MCVLLDVHSCSCAYECFKFLHACFTWSDTSRQVCGGCGNSTVSRQAASWETRWDWVKPSRSSAFWLDWATANWGPEDPTTGAHTQTHTCTQTVARDCVSVWYEYLIRGISAWECSSELLNMFQLSDSSLSYCSHQRKHWHSVCVCVWESAS